MATKKKPVPSRNVKDVQNDDSLVEPVQSVDWPAEPMRTRLETLLKRRGPFGSLIDTIQPFWTGSNPPKTDDDWMAIINRLER